MESLAAFLIRRVVGVLGRSCRWREPEGEPIDRWIGREGPVVLVAWHEQAVLLAHWMRRRILAQGIPMAVMSSQSRDGEIGARTAAGWGVRVERGSSSRGGSVGLRRLYRALKKDGFSVVFLVDGPRGPRYEAKPGAVVLAKMAGAPIVPMAFRADRSWHLKSWDRMIVPKPFTRVTVRRGEPFEIPPDADVETARVRLQDVLNGLKETPKCMD